MVAIIGTVAIGLVAVVIGIINMTGNISTLHRYHRNRVSEADRKPFGRLVGIGTIIMGVSIIAFGGFQYAFEKTQREAFTLIGTALMLVGITVGLTISVIAMAKYNKGVF